MSAEERNARLNPFFIDERPMPEQRHLETSSGPRSIPQLLQILSKISLREFVGRHLKTAQVYQAFQGALSLDEIKTIKQFMSAQRQNRAGPDDTAEIDMGSDFIDMDDLIEAIELKHNLDTRPAQEHSFGGNNGPSSAELESMQRKIGRILREKDDDAEFFSSKIRQLKRSLKEANLERCELTEQVEKLEKSKSRLEKFYKDKMGLTIDGNQTLGETLAKTKTGELLGEVGIIQRRLEYMEE